MFGKGWFIILVLLVGLDIEKIRQKGYRGIYFGLNVRSRIKLSGW